jgi:hypothetical protein
VGGDGVCVSVNLKRNTLFSPFSERNTRVSYQLDHQEPGHFSAGIQRWILPEITWKDVSHGERRMIKKFYSSTL